MRRTNRQTWRERERDFSLSSSSYYIGTNLFMRTQNRDGIKEQKFIVSVLESRSRKSRGQQDYVLSKTWRAVLLNLGCQNKIP